MPCMYDMIQHLIAQFHWIKSGPRETLDEFERVGHEANLLCGEDWKALDWKFGNQGAQGSSAEKI